MKRLALLIILVFIMSSCSMPETKIYTLSLSAPESLNNRFSDSSVSIKIEAPSYLEQPYIARRVSEYQIEISRYSKWASSPADIVKISFKDSFSPLFKEVRTSGYAPEGFYVIDLTLRKFERTDTENGSFAELVFDVKMLSPEGEVIYKDTISKRVELDGNDNAELAKELSSALSDAIREVGDSVTSKIR